MAMLNFRNVVGGLVLIKKKYLGTFARFSTLKKQKWAVSSVGLERYLDRVEVTGSNPVQLT